MSIDPQYFSSDDYIEIERKYFVDIRSSGVVDADPSGWLFSQTSVAEMMPTAQVGPLDLVQYRVDEDAALGDAKERIQPLLSAWEATDVFPNEFTICPSGACASLVALATVKSLGIRHVVFETPAYFGSIEQAIELGLSVELVPTFRRTDYMLPDVKRLLGTSDTALWLTQPRASLGFDQSQDLVIRILQTLRHTQFLIVDEVTDQTFPAHLSRLVHAGASTNVIRLRSFTKPMGINGIRLAAILHSATLRPAIVGCLEAFGGSLEIHSLRLVGTLAEDITRFRHLLRIANDQVNKLRVTAERLATGTPISVNHLVNGYIGSMIVDLRVLGSTHEERRARLLAGCRAKRTPVMLGSTFYMAKDPPTEAIRLNFFNHPEHIVRGINNVAAVLAGD